MNAASKLIRILVVSDHPIVRGRIVALVAMQPDMRLVGEGANGREAIELFRSLRPDARLVVVTTYSGDVQALRTQGRSPSLRVFRRKSCWKRSAACTRAASASATM